jgi:hypothetical protein
VPAAVRGGRRAGAPAAAWPRRNRAARAGKLPGAGRGQAPSG